MPEAGSGGNVIAALASFFIPGLGQLVQGRIGLGLMGFVAEIICIGIAIALLVDANNGWQILVGILIVPTYHIIAAVDAARWTGSDV